MFRKHFGPGKKHLLKMFVFSVFHMSLKNLPHGTIYPSWHLIFLLNSLDFLSNASRSLNDLASHGFIPELLKLSLYLFLCHAYVLYTHTYAKIVNKRCKVQNNHVGSRKFALGLSCCNQHIRSLQSCRGE